MVESAATATELEELESAAKGVLRKVMRLITKALTSQLFLRTLSVVALAASAKKVLEDAEPGGHHAAVLVALNDVFGDLKGAGIELFGLTALVLETSWLQIAVHGGAARLAGLEVWADVCGAAAFSRRAATPRRRAHRPVRPAQGGRARAFYQRLVGGGAEV